MMEFDAEKCRVHDMNKAEMSQHLKSVNYETGQDCKLTQTRMKSVSEKISVVSGTKMPLRNLQG